ncbi:MAG: putative ABC transporter permease [Eggerthellaceae bacterium]|nr:putative ABC transporter permease [Eggerthellaceae bacterium]
MLGSWYAYAAASDPDRLLYNLSFWRAGASTVGTALAGWLAHRRSPAALPTAVATAAATVGLGILNKRKTGSYVTRTWDKASLKESIFNRAMPVLHAVESTALVGVAAVASAQRPTKYGPLSSAPWYPLARKLGLYYMVFSLVGHWAEMLFCTGIKYGIFKGGYDRENHMLWDQWLFPFPAEGTAAVLAELALTPVKNAVEDAVNTGKDRGFIPEQAAFPLALGASFLVNQVVCTSIDYATGMVANRNDELWDYRDMRFHYKGQICLQNSLLYSAIATWAVWVLLPVLDKALKRAGDTKLDGSFVGLGSFYAFLLLLYHVLPKDREL